MLVVHHRNVMQGQFHVIATRPDRSEFCAASYPYANSIERRAMGRVVDALAAGMGGRVLECVAADPADRFCHYHGGPLAHCTCAN